MQNLVDEAVFDRVGRGQAVGGVFDLHVTGLVVAGFDRLVVDAMGRGARTPAFLEALGYGRPDTEHSTANATYASQLLRMPAGMVNEKMTMVFPEPNLPTGGALSSYGAPSLQPAASALPAKQPATRWTSR